MSVCCVYPVSCDVTVAAVEVVTARLGVAAPVAGTEKQTDRLSINLGSAQKISLRISDT